MKRNDTLHNQFPVTTLFRLSVLILLTVLAPPLNLQAQKIYFSDTSNVWEMHFSNMHWEFPHSYQTIAYLDSTVESGGHTYQLLGDGVGSVMVREDTAAGKVYLKYKTGSSIPGSNGLFVSDTSEFVLYDYHLTAGDSLVMPMSNSEDTSVHVLDSVTIVTIDGIARKMQHFHFTRGFYGQHPGYRVIEGIGSEWGLFNLCHPNNFEVSCNLNCFYNKGANPEDLRDIFSLVTCGHVIGVDDRYREPFLLDIYPNPANSELVVSTQEKGLFLLKVLDMTCRSYYQGQFKDKCKINVAPWPKGIYLLQVTNKDGKWIARKVQIK